MYLRDFQTSVYLAAVTEKKLHVARIRACRAGVFYNTDLDSTFRRHIVFIRERNGKLMLLHEFVLQ